MGHWCNWMKWSTWKGLIHCGCWVNIAEWNLNFQITTHIRVYQFWLSLCSHLGSPGGISGKEPTCQCRRPKRGEFKLWVRRIPGRSLAGYSPYSLKELDTTERLSMTTCKPTISQFKTLERSWRWRWLSMAWHKGIHSWASSTEY